MVGVQHPSFNASLFVHYGLLRLITLKKEPEFISIQKMEMGKGVLSHKIVYIPRFLSKFLDKSEVSSFSLKGGETQLFDDLFGLVSHCPPPGTSYSIESLFYIGS